MNRNIPTQQHIKSMHLKEIFLAALHSGGTSRAHLKQELHLSFPSVSALVDELLVNHVLLETDVRETPERGRPRTVLRINPKALAIPVLVMTREGYHCAVYDCAANCLEKGFLPFSPDAQANHPHTGRWYPSAQTLCAPLQAWSRRISRMYRVSDLLLVVPGTANEAEGLSSSALQMTVTKEFLPRLMQSTGWNVIVQNNSDCCAYAEKICRSLSEDFIYIYIGEGVGAGIIRSGKVFQNQGRRAGEIGHISIHYNGRTCSCGRKGCLESYISTTAIIQDTRNVLTDPSKSVTTFQDVCAAYTSGNPDLAQLLREKAQLLSVGIHNMLSMQPVSHVILGGEIEQLGPDFLALVQTSLQERSHHIGTAISYTTQVSGAESLGAVWNYLDHLMEIERMFPS